MDTHSFERRAVGEITRTLAPRATQSSVAKTNTSGIDGIAVIGVVAGLAVLFLFLVLVSGICKLVNRPRSEAGPYWSKAGMYQPSASGYGALGQGGKSALPPGASPDLGGSRTNLLEGASPMGQGGRGGEEMYQDEPAPVSRVPGTHARGPSSGVNLPGPPAAARRGGGGASGSHPPLTPVGESFGPDPVSPGFPPRGPPVGPDGSGVQPGQVFNHAAFGGPPGPRGAPNGYAPRTNGYGRGPGASGSQQSQQRPMNRGPPPALDAQRGGRYTSARRSRIDSLGPGTYRKSMFETDPDAANLGRSLSKGSQAGAGLGQTSSSSHGHGTTAGGLRRVESIGKGDPRRRSNYVRNGGPPSNYNGSGPGGPLGTGVGPASARGQGIVDARAFLSAAQADGFGAGRRSPSPSPDGRGPSPGPMGGPGPGMGAPRGYAGGPPGPGAPRGTGAPNPNGPSWAPGGAPRGPPLGMAVGGPGPGGRMAGPYPPGPDGPPVGMGPGAGPGVGAGWAAYGGRGPPPSAASAGMRMQTAGGGRQIL